MPIKLFKQEYRGARVASFTTPNTGDPDLTDWAHAYYGSNYARLVQVKHRYDPDRLFRFPQAVK